MARLRTGTVGRTAGALDTAEVAVSAVAVVTGRTERTADDDGGPPLPSSRSQRALVLESPLRPSAVRGRCSSRRASLHTLHVRGSVVPVAAAINVALGRRHDDQRSRYVVGVSSEGWSTETIVAWSSFRARVNRI